MKIKQLSDTQFLVASRSLQCPRCTRRFDARKRERLSLDVGSQCPDCGAVLKQVLGYQNDLVENFPIGRCACPAGVNRNSEARKLTTVQRVALDDIGQDKLRCPHLRAARSFALNQRLAPLAVHALQEAKAA